MRYLIQLKPLSPYFFGSENTFGYNVEKNESYIIHSMLLPQQTSVLGMVRKKILDEESNSKHSQFKIKEDFKYNQDEWSMIDNCIGTDSFDLKKTKQSFGHIKSISPVFIIHNNSLEESYMMPLPMDHNFIISTDAYSPMEKEDPTKSVLLNTSKDIELPFGYDAKQWEKQGAGDSWLELSLKDKSYNKIYKKDEIFLPEERIGIKRHAEGTSSIGSFFKHEFVILKKDFSFAFFLELDNYELRKESVVYLGGERSAFKMIFKPSLKSFQDLLPRSDDPKKIILWSDSLLERKALERYVDFAISKAIDFRSLQLDRKKCSINGKEGKYTKSPLKYGFLKRGSVLYSNDVMELEKQISSLENLVKIGYNIVDSTKEGLL